MATAGDFVRRSLKSLGVIAANETPTADQMADGLTSLNTMLGLWSASGMMIPSVVREEFTLVSGTGSYTMGSGATFSTTRPVNIVAATLEIQGSDPYEVPLEILRSAQEWAEISHKALTSEVPCAIYPEGTYPNETINIWPVPSAAEKLVIYSEKPLTSASTSATEISLPPGYDALIWSNLCEFIASEYSGVDVPPAIQRIAQSSYKTIERQNTKIPPLRCDPALISGPGYYDINLGRYR